MTSPTENEEQGYDKVTQASLNGIYVKARKLDRGHNVAPAPAFLPPGSDARTCVCAYDAESHASDGADAVTQASGRDDAATCASAASGCVRDALADAVSRASDADADAESHASESLADGGPA